MQLVVYLNAAMELAAKNHSRKEIVPAAVLYYHVADPMVERVGEAISPEELNAQLLQEKIFALLNNPGKLNQMKDNSKRLGYPQAAENIYKLMFT